MNFAFVTAIAFLTSAFYFFDTKVVLADEKSDWKNCLYNGEVMSCRRNFLCGNASPPCYSFQLEWKDGFSDSFTRDVLKPSYSKNIGFYKDPRGGEWELISYTGSFFLINSQNKNTIIYDMTREECSDIKQWNYLCPG